MVLEKIDAGGEAYGDWINRSVLRIDFVSRCVLLLCALVLQAFLHGYPEGSAVSRVGQKVDAQGTFEEKMTVLTTFDNIKLERARNEYDSKYSVYVFWSQMVPLFSSLGLLGTVLGLILSSSGDIEIESLMSSLGLAMWTTFVGLICTIVLKFVDSIGPGRVINDIDSAFTRLDEKMSKELYKKAGSSQ